MELRDGIVKGAVACKPGRRRTDAETQNWEQAQAHHHSAEDLTIRYVVWLIPCML